MSAAIKRVFFNWVTSLAAALVLGLACARTGAAESAPDQTETDLGEESNLAPFEAPAPEAPQVGERSARPSEEAESNEEPGLDAPEFEEPMDAPQSLPPLDEAPEPAGAPSDTGARPAPLNVERSRAPTRAVPARGAQTRAGNAQDRRASGRADRDPRPVQNASASDYSRFKIILDRNIFDASRSSRRERPRQETTRRPAQVDAFTLVGTLIYDNRARAFFDGSQSDYRKVLEPGKTIASHTVKSVGANRVELTKDGVTIELHVGDQMRRIEEGWRVESNSAVTAVTESAASASSSDSDADESDIIKKLMEKRERELRNER